MTGMVTNPTHVTKATSVIVCMRVILDAKRGRLPAVSICHIYQMTAAVCPELCKQPHAWQHSLR